ncbi:unnamed protein product [Durusdinium trenchii]|uniref:Uncharacterized protein n=1 Tax=Durusdinium trenchii TaxID=1381693 RepID=A0ABP0JWX5_9DINO
MAGSDSDDWLMEDEAGNWAPVVLHDRANETARTRSKVITKHWVNSRALMAQPISTWQATSEWDQQFRQVASVVGMYAIYKASCLKRALKPLSRGQFCWEKMTASGWVLKRGKFIIAAQQERQT